MELTVKLQVFEGPLDLLLYLLEKNKVNIYDIPIVEITEQYMEYIREMKRQDLEVLSEFLVMAATLIDTNHACFSHRIRTAKRKKKIRVRNWYSSFWNTRCTNVWRMN
mgnify:CR=1 FL=1